MQQSSFFQRKMWCIFFDTSNFFFDYRITFSRRLAIWWKWVILDEFFAGPTIQTKTNDPNTWTQPIRNNFTISKSIRAYLSAKFNEMREWFSIIFVCYANGVILRLYCRASICMYAKRIELKLQIRNFRSVIVFEASTVMLYVNLMRSMNEYTRWMRSMILREILNQ